MTRGSRVRAAQRCFRWLMWAYPPAFRRAHGLALVELFRDEARAAAAAGTLPLVRMLVRALIDTLENAPPAWASVSRARRLSAPRPMRVDWSGWRHDARSALRQLRHAPGFSLISIAMLAIGIGANVTIFTVANAVLLKPLASRDPDRVVRIIGHPATGAGTMRFSFPELSELRDGVQAFDALAGVHQSAFNVQIDGRRDELIGEIVTASYLPMLDARIAFGRGIGPEDDRPGAPPVMVIGEALWRRQFGRTPEVIGRSVIVNGEPRTIVGIAASSFHGSFLASPTDLWLPLATSGRQFGPGWEHDRSRRLFVLIGRLAQGVSRERAQAEASTRVSAMPPVASGPAIARIEIAPGTLAAGRQRALARTFLTVLTALVGLVLLVVCANVANLMLARLLGRRRELAIRVALGAARARVARLLTLECTILGLLGGGAALLLSRWTTNLLTAVQPLPTFGLRLDTSIDWRVAGFACALALATSIALAAIGSLQVFGQDVGPALKEETLATLGRQSSGRIRGVLVAAQISVSMLLLVGAALFSRSLANAESIDLGLDPDGVIAVDIDGSGRHTPSENRQFFDRIVARIASDPRVRAVAVSTRAPLDSSTPVARVSARNVVETHDTAMSPTASYLVVTPAFFDVVQTPIVAGRAFSIRDDDKAQDVVVVNETLARRLWPGDAAIGKRLWIESSVAARSCVVVGVARNSRYLTLGEEQQAHFYLPFAQHPHDSMAVLLRSAEPPDAAIALVQDAIAAADPLVQGFFPRTLAQHISVSVLPVRLAARLSFAVAALGSVLAVVGLYALVSFVAAERTQEIGLRMALGASPKAVVMMIAGGGLRLGLMGLAVGIPVALAASRVFASLLYGVTSTDPLSFAAVSIAIVVLTFVACIAPALHAARLDPLSALRRP